jgi:hypothetical protein
MSSTSYSYAVMPPMNATGVCNKTSNNKYFECGPIMNDGRAFTDYRASSLTNAIIQGSNKMSNNQEYRQFMIQNAEQIMKINQNNAEMKVQCGPCDAKIPGSEIDCYYTPDGRQCEAANCGSGLGIVNRAMPMNSWKILPYDPTMRNMSSSGAQLM